MTQTPRPPCTFQITKALDKLFERGAYAKASPKRHMTGPAGKIVFSTVRRATRYPEHSAP